LLSLTADKNQIRATAKLQFSFLSCPVRRYSARATLIVQIEENSTSSSHRSPRRDEAASNRGMSVMLVGLGVLAFVTVVGNPGVGNMLGKVLAIIANL
jgi:hypothetical protein